MIDFIDKIQAFFDKVLDVLQSLMESIQTMIATAKGVKED